MKTFRARETAWLQELDGIELADFWQRALAISIDFALGIVFMFAVLIAVAFGVTGWRWLHGYRKMYNIHIQGDTEGDKLLLELLMLVLYSGLFTWLGRGRSPGKRLLRIRVISLVHRHLSLWHSVERALGYAAAGLEFGFGFIQYFIHPYRRTVQDRIAETIVVKERSYRRKVRGDHVTEASAIVAPEEATEIAVEEAAVPEADAVAD